MSKFGLDYLIKKERKRAVEQPPQAEQAQSRPTGYVEGVTASLGREILLKLKTLKDTGCDACQLNDLVDALNVDRDTLGLVVGRMADLGMLEVERDKYGNHSVRLTHTGEESLNLTSP